VIRLECRRRESDTFIVRMAGEETMTLDGAAHVLDRSGHDSVEDTGCAGCHRIVCPAGSLQPEEADSILDGLSSGAW
jgi:hypothetical protein